MRRHALALSLAGLLAAVPAADAAKLAGVDSRNRLVTFDSARPGSAKAVAITGLADGEVVQGLDRRPADGRLYALGATSRTYVVAADGKATLVGPGPFSPVLEGRGFGWDFNPMVDRLRLVTDFGQNLRLQPDMGTVAATDGRLAYGTGDASAGKAPGVVAAAYTNNVPMAQMTQLFVLDTRNDVLALQDPPNAGGLKTVGALGFDLTNPASFDVAAGSGQAFVAARQTRAKGSRLFSVDLASGRAARIAGRVGSRRAPLTLRGLTVVG